jgi:formylglycine-generating enzyme required for sulfatase activity
MSVKRRQIRQSTGKRGRGHASRPLRLILLLAVAVTGVGWWLYAGRSQAPASAPTEAADSTVASFGSTVENAKPTLGAPPAGMVWIPGGEFSMGATESSDMNMVGMQATIDSRPIHRVYVDGFWMDETEVTNEQFAKFVEATRYVTVAEKAPRAEDFPGAPPENLVAGAVVFSPPDHAVPLNDHFQWWAYVKGASWRHPDGPESNLVGREHHPVVQIAYDDAVAYATWAGKRLPTEAEWEFAARGGLSGQLYAWGDEFTPSHRFMANTHQGHFPDADEGEDGYRGIGPVAHFERNGYGLYDVAGNVWEWVSDWYRPDYYAQLASAGGVARNPRGPDTSFDPTEPTVQKRVHRGGSFLCTDQYCSRYMVGTRGKGEGSTGTNHVGLRLVKVSEGDRSK